MACTQPGVRWTRRLAASGDPPAGRSTPKKRRINNPGRFRDSRRGAQVRQMARRSQMAARRAGLMKAGPLAAKVDGYTRGLVWNVPQKKWTNQDRSREQNSLRRPDLSSTRAASWALPRLRSPPVVPPLVHNRKGRRSRSMPCEWNRTHKRPLRHSASTENTRGVERRRSESRH